MMPEPVILAVDVGLSNTGVAAFTPEGILRSWDALVTTSKACVAKKMQKSTSGSGKLVRRKVARPKVTRSESDRLRVSMQIPWLDEWLEAYQVLCVAAEMPTGGARSSAAVRGMAFAAGAFTAFCELRKLEWVGLTPQACKIRFCGHKLPVTKEETQHEVCRRYPEFANRIHELPRNKLEPICDAIQCGAVYFESIHGRSCRSDLASA